MRSSGSGPLLLSLFGNFAAAFHRCRCCPRSGSAQPAQSRIGAVQQTSATGA